MQCFGSRIDFNVVIKERVKHRANRIEAIHQLRSNFNTENRITKT